MQAGRGAAEKPRATSSALPGPRRAAAGVLGALALLALLAPWLAPYDPLLASGAPLSSPGPGHLLGTNDIGQDVWSEWLLGGRASLLVGLLVALLSTGLAWGVGLLAALWRQGAGLLLGVTDLLLALPPLPLLLLVVALIGPSQTHLVLVLGLLSWPAYARVVRIRVLSVASAPYVEAARAVGGSPLRVALRHVAPATLELLPAKLALTVRFALFAEATLAFLGLGDPAARSWGTMLGTAFNNPLVFATGAWTWWVLPPALAIVGAVLSATCLTPGDERLDWVRRAHLQPGAADEQEAAPAPRRPGLRRVWAAHGPH